MLRLLGALLLGLLALQLLLLPLARLLGRPLRAPAVVLGWGLPLLLLAPWLSGHRLLVPSNLLEIVVPGAQGWQLPTTHSDLNDVVYQLVPWELEVRHALAAGRLPLWSDALGGGSSPWSNPQAQVLSPLAMAARAIPIQYHTLALIAFELLLAFEGAWVLARLLGARSAPALLGATGVAFGGAIIAWALFPLATTVAWGTWVIAGVVALARGRGAPALLALALATAAMLLSGHPEAALGIVALAVLVGGGVRARQVTLPRWLALAGAGGTLGTMLAAPLLVPFALAAERSLRAGERLQTAPGPWLPGAGETWFAGGGWRFFLYPWSPGLLGEPYAPPFPGAWAWPVSLAAYGGLAVAAGAAAALVARRRRAAALLIGWALALLTASGFTPWAALLQRLPVLRLMEPTRLVPVATLALAIAAALGWDALLRGHAAAPRVAAAAVLALGVGLAPAPGVALLAALVLVGAVLLRVRPRLAVAVLAVATLLELLPWGRAQLPRGEPALFYPRTPYIERLAQVAHEAGGPWRVVGEAYQLYPSLLTVYGLDEARVHDPLAPRSHLAVLTAAFGFAPTSVRYFSPFGHVEHPLLDFLGVRAVASFSRASPKARLAKAAGGTHYRRRQGRWVKVDSAFGPHEVYRNAQALPRWFLPRDVALVPRAVTLAWIRGMTDARVVALVAEQAKGWRPPPRAWDASAVRALRSVPGDVELAVAGTGDRLLATSLPGPFGWRAKAGGRALPTLTVDGAFLGVRVPAGVERVELRYVPPGLPAGAALAALAMAVLAAVGWKMVRGAHPTGGSRMLSGTRSPP